MKLFGTVIVLVVTVVVILIVSGALYVVDETEQVIVTRFGKPVSKPEDIPGLKFKLPFIDKANRFDKRFLEWDGDANQLPTKDKRFIWVDTYARWQITDPLKFFQRLRDELGAQSRLDDILDGETRNAIAAHELVELVRNTNRRPAITGIDEGEPEIFQNIKTGRDKIRERILSDAKVRVKDSDLGIEILDVQFKRISYVDEVRRKVYERMIAERNRIADRYRSEGQGEAFKILGKKARDLAEIQSGAFREAEQLRGNADAEATAIYANAYDATKKTREFYEFLKTMETFAETQDSSTWLVLSSEGEFYRYLNASGAGVETAGE